MVTPEKIKVNADPSKNHHTGRTKTEAYLNSKMIDHLDKKIEMISDLILKLDAFEKFPELIKSFVATVLTATPMADPSAE